MSERHLAQSSPSGGLPVAPSLAPLMQTLDLPEERQAMDSRALLICALALGVGLLGGAAAQLLKRLIALCTSLAYYGRFSIADASPWGHHLGAWAIVVPVVGGLIVGAMARYGSKAIRGHGIPEAMEQVLTNHSRVAPRLTWLKPVSAAVAIGTGGPFGAEGPIIATGGALGSVIGQAISVDATERKTLLAAGAAAGMAATFGCPISAVILAIELLLFEFRARSFIPVALAAAAAGGFRALFEGSVPFFPMEPMAQPGMGALALFLALGAAVGAASVLVTRAVYWVEDAFERLPIHWMWWPALGGLAVGLAGRLEPRTLGVGYANISDLLAGRGAAGFIAVLCGLKFVSWAISLGSGTSGGTLAPLMTFGGGLGALIGMALDRAFPGAGFDPRMAALVGMAAMFAGASRAVLASTVFALETTLRMEGILPLVVGCAAACLVSQLLMRHSIMTAKIERRGVRVPGAYLADPLEQIVVESVAARKVASLAFDRAAGEVARWMASGEPGSAHQGYPVLGAQGQLLGVVTRRQVAGASPDDPRKIADMIERPPVAIYSDCTLRQAAEQMARHEIGRLPVLRRESGGELVGIVTRSDLLAAYRRGLEDRRRAAPTLSFSARPRASAS